MLAAAVEAAADLLGGTPASYPLQASVRLAMATYLRGVLRESEREVLPAAIAGERELS